MADIVKYTPTVNMASSERTLDGYYACIKAWVQEIYDDVFSKWFTAEYDDTNHKIVLTPKSSGCNQLGLKFNLATSGTLSMLYGVDSATKDTDYGVDISLSSNQDIWLYSADYFFIGSASFPVAYSILRGKRFNGADVLIHTAALNADYGNDYPLFFWDDNVYKSKLAKIALSLSGTSEYYIARNVVPFANAIMTDMYYLDGGTSGNVPKGVFKIGDNKYCTVNPQNSVGNIVVKL